MIEAIKSGMVETVTTISDSLTGSLSFLTDMKDAGWEKMTALINDLLGLEPLIESTGFYLKEFSVDATIPPSLVHVFFKEKDVDQATIDKILEENKDKEMLVLIVRALQKADGLQQKMRLSDYKFYALGLKMGIPPVVSLKFLRK